MLHVVGGIMHFFGRLSFLVDENAHAVHFFVSALLQLLDRWVTACSTSQQLCCVRPPPFFCLAVLTSCRMAAAAYTLDGFMYQLLQPCNHVVRHAAVRPMSYPLQPGHATL